MSFIWNNRWFAGGMGAIIALVAATFLLQPRFRPGLALVRTSYNWSYELSPFVDRKLNASPVVVVYMDEDSHRTLGQPFDKPWDRGLHALLLNRLKAEGASNVVFDIIFTGAGENVASDDEFVEALRKFDGVVLGADIDPRASKDVADAIEPPVYRPYEPFENAASSWGIAHLLPDDDFIVRMHYPGLPGVGMPSLSWALARLMNLPLASHPENRMKERWLRYYGPPETIPHISYWRALDPNQTPDGFFKDKVVFIGARPMTGYYNERRDELRSPCSLYSDHFTFMPAVEVQATQALNLIRGDWFSRWSSQTEWMVVLVTALLLGFGLVHLRPFHATLTAALFSAAFTLAALALFGLKLIWFPWLIVVAAQVPLGLLWAIAYRSVEWYAHKRKLQEEKRRADERIREQAALLDKAQDAIFVHDLDGIVSYWNRSAENLYGLPSADVLGRPLNEECFQLKSEKSDLMLSEVMQKGEWGGELLHKSSKGTELTVQSRWTLVRDATGQPKEILVIDTDITEQKKLEAQFLRTQRMESIGTLAGGIAHDLNNVLSPVMLGVEMLQMQLKDEKNQKLLKTIHSSARRGSDLVKQVLTFARGHGGEKAVLQTSHLIKEMDKMIRETFPRSIEFEYRIAKDLWTVMADATQMHQVLLNFCVNARDAMPGGGKIDVEASNVTLDEPAASRLPGGRPGRYMLIRVSDNGSGIPQKIVDKIFEPFFTTKELGKGTGLGLSTVMTIIKNHDGILDLETEVGKGTTFRIYLPAAESSLAKNEAEVDPRKLFGRGELILVVDDEPAIRETMQATLAAHGYRVITAMNGADAIGVYSEQNKRVSLAFVDMMMPVMDGPHTIQRLLELQPDIGIIAMSGVLQADKAREKMDRENITFLSKPFSTDKLLLALRQNLDGSPPFVAVDQRKSLSPEPIPAVQR